MRTKKGNFVGIVLLCVVVIALVATFGSISRGLLKLVNGSFAPAQYSSLSLAAPSEEVSGIKVGQLIPVTLSNHRGHTVTYLWSAIQNGVVSEGRQTLSNGKTVIFDVPTRGAEPGVLRISLRDSNIFVTVRLGSS